MRESQEAIFLMCMFSVVLTSLFLSFIKRNLLLSLTIGPFLANCLFRLVSYIECGYIDETVYLRDFFIGWGFCFLFGLLVVPLCK